MRQPTNSELIAYANGDIADMHERANNKLLNKIFALGLAATLGLVGMLDRQAEKVTHEANTVITDAAQQEIDIGTALQVELNPETGEAVASIPGQPDKQPKSATKIVESDNSVFQPTPEQAEELQNMTRDEMRNAYEANQRETP
jgi:hypothetical protein